jgi:hypothetical protein
MPQTPRFNEQLSPKEESYWEAMVKMTMSLSGTLDQTLLEIWHDATLPPAFRDRAMLLMVGSGIRQIVDTSAIEAYDPPAFSAWVHEAKQYQDQTGVQLIDEECCERWLGDNL